MRRAIVGLTLLAPASCGSPTPAPTPSKAAANGSAKEETKDTANDAAAPDERENGAGSEKDYAAGAPRCPALPDWVSIDPPDVSGLPGDEAEFSVTVSNGVGRLVSQNPWLHFDAAAEPAAKSTGKVVINEHTRVFRGATLEAEHGDEKTKVRCVQPEVHMDAPSLGDVEAEQRRDVTDIMFHGGVVSIAGDTVSFSFTDGLEERDCGHHVVPVSHHWVREAADTGRFYIAIEDREAGEECKDESVTPRAIASTTIPDGITKVHVIFDLVPAKRDGTEPYVRHDKTIPVAPDSHVLHPR